MAQRQRWNITNSRGIGPSRPSESISENNFNDMTTDLESLEDEPYQIELEISDTEGDDNAICLSDDDDIDTSSLPGEKELFITHTVHKTNRAHEHQYGSFDLSPGSDIKFLDRTFMRVQRTENNPITGQISFVYGYLLVKPDPELHLLSMPERELIILMHANPDGVARTQVRRKVSTILSNCNIVFTNQPLSELNAESDAEIQAEDSSPLARVTYFCRLKRVLPSEKECLDKKGNTRHTSGIIEWLRAEECDEKERTVHALGLLHAKVPDRSLRDQWRSIQNRSPRGNKASWDGEKLEQQYTFNDFFCGGGGASSGAYQAGFALNVAIDFDHAAIETYKANFAHTGVEARKLDIHDYVQKAGRDLRKHHVCDVSHFSPACKAFSCANVRPNPELDALNHASFLAVHSLINLVRPRIATFEEADALVWPDERRRPFFTELVDILVRYGYSVVWKVVKLEEWGVPQKRRRLIIIASCPGERLPSFPKSTHGTSPGNLRLSTLRSALQSIPQDSTDHNPHAMKVHHPCKAPLDLDGLSATIKCSGDAEKVYHPSGKRQYTVREMGTIQGFPHSFVFCGGVVDKKRVIGNAFPPVAAKRLFMHVKEWLEFEDQREIDGL